MPFAQLCFMKRILIYATILSTLFVACQNSGGTSSSDEDDNEAKSSAKKISKRDYSINESNSYSSLFLDSTQMERYFTEKQVPDSISRRMRSFYNTRNYQFAWFSADGLTEQARGFWNLHDYVTTYDNDTTLRDKALQKRMDRLISEEKLSVSGSDKSYANTELQLTQHFILYALHNYDKGYVKRKEMERFIPFKKENVMAYADSLLNKKHKDNKYFEDVNQPYKLLKEQLGFAGYKLGEFGPRQTRRATAANWLLSYMQQISGGESA